MKPHRTKPASVTVPPGALQSAPASSPRQAWFAAFLGGLLGLALCKFGNPAFLASHVTTPTDPYEWLLSAWPIGLGQLLLLGVALAGLLVARKPHGLPLWITLAPLPWLVWLWIATALSTEPAVSVETTLHLTGNVACFYLGLFCLAAGGDRRAFWTLLLGGYAVVLLWGWQQHFGGLEATREMVHSELSPEQIAALPPEFVKRMNSDRIFATLFYPNTLAGTVLLFLPVILGMGRLALPNPRAYRIGMGLIVALSAGCLVWSGSKAGWLLALALGFVALWRLRLSRTLRLALAAGVLMLGAGGFYVRYSGYLERGATSAVARLDYWQAAARITAAHPLTGTGPGTFAKHYERIKRPESEMARATHNDYIQQACDSGIPGLLTFAAFLVGLVTWTGVRLWRRTGWGHFLVWLGVLGIALQCLVEFSFYVPAISWPFMVLLGWLVARSGNASTLNQPHP